MEKLTGAKRKRSKSNDENTEIETKKKHVEEENKLQALKNIQSLLKVSEQFSLYFKKKLDNDKSVQNEFDTHRVNEKLDDLCYFNGTLRDYQVEGVKWLRMLYENGMNGILADEMGLGKTVQVIAFISFLMEKNINCSSLILTPLSTIPNWRSEFKRFTPTLPVIVFHGDKNERRKLKENVLRLQKSIDKKPIYPIVIAPYHSILMEETFFCSINWKNIVLDEGHKIKNHKSKLHKLLKMFKSDNRIILTGTPIQNNLNELWSLLNFLMPKIFNKIDTFSMLLGIDEINNKEYLINNEKENNLISKIHKVLEPFILRRLKSEVLADIVPKKEILMYCPLTPFQKTLYMYTLDKKEDCNKENVIDINLPREARSCRKIKNYSYEFNVDNYVDVHKEAELSKKKNVDHYSIINSLITNAWVLLKKIVDHPYLIQHPIDSDEEYYKDLLSGSGKMLVLDTMLSKLKRLNHKILLFSTFTTMLDIIEDLLNYKGYKYRRLDGSVSLNDRDVAMKEFNEDSDIFVFLLSTRAGGVGLNLTGADTVIFYDRDWNPQIDIQAQDRCHRIGQTRPVMIYTLVGKNTIDEKIIKSGESKKKLERIVIGEGNFNSLSNIGTDINRIDIHELKSMLEATESCKIVQSTGLYYTDDELDTLLDRSDLYEQMKMH